MAVVFIESLVTDPASLIILRKQMSVNDKHLGCLLCASVVSFVTKLIGHEGHNGYTKNTTGFHQII
jgi:hypothetical protein